MPGLFGDGEYTNQPAPIAVAALANIVEYAAASGHACSVGADKVAKCWGSNAFGVAGVGNDERELETPTPVEDLTEPVTVVQLASETLTPQADAERPTALPTDGKVAELTGVPEGCPSKMELEVKVAGKPLPFTARKIEAKWAWQGLGYAIDMLNYDLDEKNPWSMPRGSQARISFGLEKWVIETGPDGKETIVQKPADKEQPYVTDLTASYRTTNAAGIYDNHKQRFFNQGQITITHLDDKWVCGEIDLSHDKDGHVLEGKFGAAIPPKP